MNLRYCPNYSVPLSAELNGNHLVYKPRCKKWSCPYCAIINKKIWRGRIMSEIESTPQVENWYFWTLTLLGCDHRGLIHSMQIWRDKWAKLRKRIVRNLGKLRYIRIFEMHKSGTLHIHMLADKSYSDVKTITETSNQKTRHESKTLRDHLTELDLGYIHDIKPIETKETAKNGVSRNVSAYIVKYMTKNSMEYVRDVLRESGTNIRIIQTSHKWYNETKQDSELDWQKQPIFKTAYEALGASFHVEDITTKQIITIDDFYEYEHYPNRTSDLVDIADNEMEYDYKPNTLTAESR